MSLISKQLQRLEAFFLGPSEVFKKEVEFATGKSVDSTPKIIKKEVEFTTRESVDTTPKFIKQRQERLNKAKEEINQINSKLDYKENDDILLFVKLVQKKNRSAK